MDGAARSPVIARPGRDCATRVRMRYQLPRPLAREDAAWLPEAELAITEFSLFVAGARDHLRLRLGAELEASGALGGTELVVTYGKLGGRHPSALVQAIERRIGAHWGPVTTEPSP